MNVDEVTARYRGVPAEARLWMPASQIAGRVFCITVRQVHNWFDAGCPFTERTQRGGKTRGNKPIEIYWWLLANARGVEARDAWKKIFERCPVMPDAADPAPDRGGDPDPASGAAGTGGVGSGSPPAAQTSVDTAAPSGISMTRVETLIARLVGKVDAMLGKELTAGAFQQEASGLKALSAEMRQLLKSMRDAAEFDREYMKRVAVEEVLVEMGRIVGAAFDSLTKSAPSSIAAGVREARVTPDQDEAFERVVLAAIKGDIDRQRARAAQSIEDAATRLQLGDEPAKEAA